jgi:L-serine dehydratase
MSSKDASPVLPGPELTTVEVPDGMDRRTFLMKSAVIGAATVITGCNVPPPKKADLPQAAAPAATGSKLSADLDVSKRAKGPVMTVIDEFYKVGPGPSSSHTIGPMRITYDSRPRPWRRPPACG